MRCISVLRQAVQTCSVEKRAGERSTIETRVRTRARAWARVRENVNVSSGACITLCITDSDSFVF